jgi:predicted transcriptional regulator
MNEPALWDPSLANVAQVLVEFAGAGNDEPSLEIARKATHDNVLAHLRAEGHRQAGPVEWRIYGRAEAASMLEQAGVADHPEAAGLLEFLQAPATVLVLCTVSYLQR